MLYSCINAVMGMKNFCFTIDDNIRFLKEITQSGYKSIFEHPYLAALMRLHQEFEVKIQLNLFYKTEGFDLSEMIDAHRSEWQQNADWLKLSFHSDFENVKPYEFSKYDEVFSDCKKVNEQIVRFASQGSLAKTTTIHYCLTTFEGIKALYDNGVLGLLGLFGTEQNVRTSYGLEEGEAKIVRSGEILKKEKMAYGAIDIVLNNFSKQEILKKLEGMTCRESISVMIHEQYFYPDYKAYQPDFEEKLKSTFAFLSKNGYKSVFFEELI